MSIKLIFLSCMLVYLCGASEIDEVCKESNTPECREKAKKCMAPHHEFSPEERKEWHAKYCKVFRTCMEKNEKVKHAYHSFVKEKHGGQDWCSDNHPVTEEHHKEHPEGKKVDFKEYLARAVGSAEASELQCCVAKEKGKFDHHGKVIVAAWKKGASMIVNPTAKAAYIKGITDCAAGNPVCSVYDFKICAIKKCLHSIN